MRIKHSQLIIFSMVAMFIADAVNTYLAKSGYDLRFYSFSLWVRIFIEVYFLLLLSKVKRIGAKVYLLILSLTAFYLAGVLSSAINGLYEENILRNIVIINKIVFVFICGGVVLAYFKDVRDRKQLFKYYEWLVLIESFIVVMGFIFKISLFASYDPAIRFGYKGIIPAQNEATGFFIIAVFYFANKFFHLESSNINLYKLVLVLFAGMLTGTKGCVIFIPIIICGYLLKYFRVGFYLKKLVCLLPVIVLIYVKWDFILSQVMVSIGYLQGQLSSLESSSDLLINPTITMLISGRNLKFLYFSNYIRRHWTIINYLFGGFNVFKCSLEVDPLDVFALFGMVGFLVFYLNYFKILGFRIHGMPFNVFYFIAIWTVVSFTGGHLVYSAINAMYLSVFILHLRSYNWKGTRSSRKTF